MTATRLTVAGSVATLLAVSLTASLGAGAGPRPDPTECRRDLSSAESALASRPDDLPAGASYRQAAIRCGQVDRAVDFFEQLVEQHPRSPNARLNAGLAYVDKIPTSSDLRQATLGRSAIGQLTKAIEIEATWLAYQTRGTVRLYYPNSFGQFKGAVADLERALAIVRAGTPQPYHVRTYVTLGDACYWRLYDLARARAIWAEGAERFPGNESLRARLESDEKVMREIVREAVNADVRVDTSLRELTADR
jgi:tetratricopeptide (TPR) repeat protein